VKPRIPFSPPELWRLSVGTALEKYQMIADGDGNIAYISIGSNLGDKLGHCRKGIDALVQSDHTVLIAQSPFYRTEPVDYLDQDWFVNAVVKVATRLEPQRLLAELKAIQIKAGRSQDKIRFGPRVLDMDILLYGNAIIDTPGLTIPHPRLHKRRFVLIPICDIDPEIVHPILNVNMQVLLNRLGDNDQKVVAFS
jgi:2-amino-4-hydroxy-6-hydroxymethyldihydropteridine diphosphokinase